MVSNENLGLPYILQNSYISNSIGQTLSLTIPETATSYTLTFPETNSAGYLKNIGSGALQWSYDLEPVDTLICNEITSNGSSISILKPTTFGANTVTTGGLISSQIIGSTSTINFSRSDNAQTTLSAYFSPRLNNTRQLGDIVSIILSGNEYGIIATEGTKLEISHDTSVTTKIGATDILNVTNSAVAVAAEIQSSQANALRLSNNSGRIRIGSLSGVQGSVTAPAIAFAGTSDTFNTGIYSSTNGSIDFTAQGSLRLTISNSLISSSGNFRTGLGSVTSVSLGLGEGNTGFYRIAAGQIGISTAGGLRVDINASRMAMSTPIHLSSGTASVPSLTFSGDTAQNSGLYLIANDNIGVSINGSQMAAFSSTGMNLNGRASLSTISIGTSKIHQWLDYGQTTAVASIPAGGSGNISVNFNFTAPTTTGMVINVNTYEGTGFGGIICNPSSFTTSGFIIYYVNLTAINGVNITFQWSARC